MLMCTKLYPIKQHVTLDQRLKTNAETLVPMSDAIRFLVFLPTRITN